MKYKLPILVFCAFCAVIFGSSVTAAEAEYSYESEGQVYRYSVVESGENYNFEFENSPGNTEEQLKAGVHVLQSVFQDSSINFNNREGYLRERAKCSLFAGGLYNYTFCIFPNDFSPDKKQRFRGFVTQLPNWKWMVVWNLLPALLLLGVIYLLTKKKGETG